MSDLTAWLAMVLLASLRLAPALLLAPPFNQLKVPSVIRVLLAIGMSAGILSESSWPLPGQVSITWTINAALAELVVGATIALALQIATAAVYFAGRTLDIQAGFGLASVIDPATRAQVPLIGTVLLMAATAAFVSSGGLEDIFYFLATSFDIVPFGTGLQEIPLGPLTAFASSAFVYIIGLVGGIMLALLIVDISIAFLSRTMPQMNILVMGLQIKVIVTLLLLPAVVSLNTPAMSEIFRLALRVLTK